ncbi:putative cupredoxin [Lupinus albus]|uniref:Putative cupredoxin n=1 Tax=Lupinus albus TaxID=3870 RepID=A0A6A4NRS5_LUPAL|nr:putative cupredoxin [Lupinus albus]
MEIMKVYKMMIMVMMIIGWLPLMVMGGPIKHKVGGSKGWYPEINFTHWSTHQHFYLGDWLCK